MFPSTALIRVGCHRRRRSKTIPAASVRRGDRWEFSLTAGGLPPKMVGPAGVRGRPSRLAHQGARM
jgi:hypothetical protein